MFPAYPGFENLPLRVEVQWQGRTRPVVAHLEQWPDSDKAVLVCAFEDADEGNWILMEGRELCRFHAPKDFLHRIVGSGAARYLKKFSKTGSQELRQIVQRSFESDDFELGVARLFLLAELPGKPRAAVHIDYLPSIQSYWCPNERSCDWIPFRLANGKITLRESGPEALNQLQNEWKNPESDARFSWEWSALSTKKKFEALTGIGYKSDEVSRVKNELERLMELILRCNSDDERCLSFELGGRSHIAYEDWVEKTMRSRICGTEFCGSICYRSFATIGCLITSASIVFGQARAFLRLCALSQT